MGGRTDQLRDEVDILEYRRGDVEALTRLISRWQPRVYGYILSMIGDRDEAWDISQELWLSVLSALGGGKGIGHFAAWLYPVAHNKCISHLRKKRRLPKAEEAPFEDADGRAKTTEEVTFRAEDARAVRECLGDLSLVLRETMLLFYMDGLSLEDVARVLHVPLGTAQSRLHYGRRKLKDMLRRKGYGNDRR